MEMQFKSKNNSQPLLRQKSTFPKMYNHNKNKNKYNSF